MDLLKPRWSEDREKAKSRLFTHWVNPTTLAWQLEVRTEDLGAGTLRMGELVFIGSADRELTLSILDEE